MRRTTLALLLLLASGSLTPSQAQWWGGGWARPCLAGCGPWGERLGGWAGPRRFVVVEGPPRPMWDGPGTLGPPRFQPAGGGWGRPPWWWREQRRRRLEARWRRSREDRPPAPTAGAFRGWAWETSAAQDRPTPPRMAARGGVAARSETAVAMLPPTSPHLVQPRATPVRRVLAAAAMIRPIPTPARRPAPVLRAVARLPEAPAQPREPRPAVSAPNRSRVPAAQALPVRPAALQNQPAPPSPAALPAPQPEAAKPADVPVAPLD